MADTYTKGTLPKEFMDHINFLFTEVMSQDLTPGPQETKLLWFTTKSGPWLCISDKGIIEIGESAA